MERKLHYSLDMFVFRTPGGIYRHQENGARGQPLAQSTGTVAPAWPRFRGCTRVARAAPPAARRSFIPLSDVCSSFWFWALVLTKLLSKVNGYIIGL